MGAGTGFHEVLVKHLADVQRRLTAEHHAAVQKLEADNLALRSENETLRAQLAIPAPSTPMSLPNVLPPAPPAPEFNVTPSDRDFSKQPSFASHTKTGADESRSNRPSSPQKADVTEDAGQAEAEPAEPSAWPIWRRLDEEGVDTANFQADLKQESLSVSTRASSDHAMLLVTNRVGWAACTLHPNSVLVVWWTMLGVALLLYDAVLIPMTSGFPLQDVTAFRTLDKIVVSYWTVDLIRTFFTGYEDRSVAGVEMRRWPIAKQYGKTWLLLDFCIVIVDFAITFVPDDGVFLVSDSGGPTRAGKATRIWRIIRVIRILRVLKMANKLWKTTQQTVSIHYALATKAVYVFVADLFVCHYMACYFCALGTAFDSTSWKTVKRMESAPIEELYPAALNWAMAQSGFSNSDIQATNAFESLYSILCGFLWMVVVCVTIGLFYTWMREGAESRRGRVEENRNLRKYLEQREVSRTLAVQLLRYFRFNYEPYENRVMEAEIKFLRDIPKVLQIRLRKEVFIGVLRQHPFLSALGTENEPALVAICQLAITELRYRMGETIFKADVEARTMLHVTSGELDYHPRKAGADSVRVHAGDWLCEGALWRRWRHRGELVASTFCELLGVDAQKVHAVLEDRINADGWDGLAMVRRHARKALGYYGASSSEPGSRLDTDNLMKAVSKAPGSPSGNGSRPPSPLSDMGVTPMFSFEDHSTRGRVRSTFCHISTL